MEWNNDLSDRFKQLLLANGTSVNYEYDANDNMTSKVIRTSDGQSQEFTYSYDATGKLIKTVGPLHDVTTNDYDANGNKIKTSRQETEPALLLRMMTAASWKAFRSVRRPETDPTNRTSDFSMVLVCENRSVGTTGWANPTQARETTPDQRRILQGLGMDESIDV